MSGKAFYDAKNPQVWLQMIRDYVAGRTAEMDPLLDWVESRTEEIIDLDEISTESGGSAPMVDQAQTIREVARQLWALLNPLLAHDGTAKGVFANVPRRNGLEAWRRLA